MKKSTYPILLIFLLFSVISLTVDAQEKTKADTLTKSTAKNLLVSAKEKKVRKNSIMLNISNPALISTKFQTIGFERVLPHNQSFTVNIGFFSIPKFGGDLADSLGLNTDYKDKGFHFSTDYRFYLTKENKYPAPRGIYLAPYYSYNHLNRENSWNREGFVEEVNTNINLNIHTFGAELGYQFIFWDRVALDLVLMGPGFGFYSGKAEITTTMDPDEESEFFNKLNDVLADKIPGYDKIIEAGEFGKRGTFETTSIGFRYIVRVGYRF